MNFAALEKITGGKISQLTEPEEIQQLVIDSRKAIASRGVLFIAIKGPNHDGHQYIPEMYQRNIRNFIIENEASVNVADFPQANFISVDDSISTLQAIAAYHRQQFDIPVIGITGSNGKTIVKEWLGEMLGENFNLLKSPKSYNSQVGVPLSVWPLNTRHQLAILEAGISQPGEMENLEKMVRPTIGIFTNIGSAHDEGFSNRAEKVAEKAKLFSHASVIIYCKDYDQIHQQLSSMENKQLISWSTRQEAANRINKIISNDRTILSFTYENNQYTFVAPFIDHASLENCIHCIITLLHLNIPAEAIQTRLHQLKGISMRLELKQGINDCQIIDDSYNNDLAGLQIALEFLQQQKQKSKKALILSDILQSGLPEKELYQQMAELVKARKIDRIFGVGSKLSNFASLFPEESSFYPDTATFLSAMDDIKFDREIILVKGARVFEFEKIVTRLQQKIHGTVLEIDLDALTHNLNFYRSQLKPETKIMVMVKAFAYGSGLGEIANLLQYHRVDYLGVAYTDEGVMLRENGVRLPIMVMNPAADDFARLLQYNLEPEIYNQELLEKVVSFASEEKKKIKIHLKIDTGMRRLGFEAADVDFILRKLKESQYLTVATVFSHLVGADDETHNDFSRHQAETFKAITHKIVTQLPERPWLHLLNSPGIVRFPQYQMDMVRLGIGLYGVEATGKQQDALQHISTLKTRISQIKHVKAGETVGYSRKGKMEQDATIATIAIGYADGYQRAFSNGNGEVLVRGKRASVVGNVCMDMTMVDITGFDARVGDEVVIFGKELPISELAGRIGTIPYEILTNVSERVKRVFFTE